jgi:membrane protein involved in colicin uptake
VTETGAAGATGSDPAREERRRRRAEREAKKKAAAEKRRAARDAKKTGTAEAATGDELEEPADAADLQRDAGAFLGVLYRIAGLVVALFGGTMAKVSKAEATEDAAAFVPILRKLPGFAKVVGYIAAPFVVVERIAEKTTRKETRSK